MIRIWLFAFLALLSVGIAGVVSAAEQEEFIVEENENNEDLNKFLLEQYEKGLADEAEQEQRTYEELLRKYPDVVPRPPPGAFTGKSGVDSIMAYDSNFANTIFFTRRSSYLTNVQEEKLITIAESMIDEPALNLIIVGHSSFNTQIEDLEKRTFYNRWISGRRAVKVWDFLVANGIDSNRLVMYALGSEEPLNGEETLREIALNQRVEVRLTTQPVAAGTNPGLTTQQQSTGNNTTQQTTQQ